MNVVIFSGTTEGRALSCQVAALGAAVTVCVATDIGAEEQGNTEGITVCTGRLTADEMAALLRGAALCVDATHPYATEATRNIRAAAQAVGVEYHRLLRPASALPGGQCDTANRRPGRRLPGGQTRKCPADDRDQGTARLRVAGPGAAVPPGAADAGRHHCVRSCGHPASQYPCDARGRLPRN